VRYLIVSDIHANLAALQSVLNDAPSFDAIWCLGDLVGYGPSPNEVIERLQEFSLVSVMGNHDWGVLGRADPYIFNTDARHALLWTRGELTPENQRFLAGLPVGQKVEDFVLVHASVREPIWEYLLDANAARKSFTFNNFRVALSGHTHIPAVFEWDESTAEARMSPPDWEEPLQLGGRRLIINAGSVGQPRDGDPRAAYGLLDTEAQTFSFHRVAYAVEITQERMRACGMPARLIERLELGR